VPGSPAAPVDHATDDVIFHRCSSSVGIRFGFDIPPIVYLGKVISFLSDFFEERLKMKRNQKTIIWGHPIRK
ncbi:MAG: hypothetical protein WCW14_01670, partial [Candidatus Paceibacterota bacterium]